MSEGPKRIDVVTTARADLSYTLPIARAVAGHPGLAARLVAAGDVPLPDELGLPVVRVPAPGLGEGVVASGRAVGALTAGFTALWAVDPPDMALLLGDRFELLGPASAAALLNLRLGHVYGGEEDVAYSIDTRIRNAITKLAHAHFVMHQAVGKRLEAMGEESWRITVCGATSVADAARDPKPFLDFARAQGWGEGPFLSATFLAPTTFPGQGLDELDAMIAALAAVTGHTVVWNSVNADPGADAVASRLAAFAATKPPNHFFVDSLGRERYFGLLASARAMVGNSSSGLLEAASFGLPVVNIGGRQTGRLAGDNVLFVPGEAKAIGRALAKALGDVAFRARCAAAPNPFTAADAPRRVAEGLAALLQLPPERLQIKRMVKGNPRRWGGLNRSVEFP